ncbi:unnamed protein product [Coregonus sp. 'balchen']|nr:unnamed protein product [Coregonus sp. 'balchen']
MWMPPSSSQEQQTGPPFPNLKPPVPSRTDQEKAWSGTLKLPEASSKTVDLTPLLAQPQPSQLHSSAPATPAATAVQLQSQQSSAVVFNLPAAPVPTTLAMKGDTFEDSQLDTDLPCTPALPDILTQKCIHWAYQD